jgi:hypothetical protein
VTLLYCTCPRRPPAPPSRRPSPPLTWRASTTCLDSNSGEEALGLPALPHTPRGTGHSRPGQEGDQGRGQLARSKPADAHSQVGPPG